MPQRCLATAHHTAHAVMSQAEHEMLYNQDRMLAAMLPENISLQLKQRVAGTDREFIVESCDEVWPVPSWVGGGGGVRVRAANCDLCRAVWCVGV